MTARRTRPPQLAATTGGGWLTELLTRDVLLDAAGHRCQCAGRCAAPHTRLPDGRCHRIDAPGRRLVAVPVDPHVTPAAAAALPLGGLVVVCPGCDTAARALVRRQHADFTTGDQPELCIDLLTHLATDSHAYPAPAARRPIRSTHSAGRHLNGETA